MTAQVIQLRQDPPACPYDREKAARMANLLFCLACSPVFVETRLPYYREVGVNADEARRLDAEAIRILRIQIESLKEPSCPQQ